MRKQKKFELMAIMEEFKKVNIPENDTFYTRDTEAFLIFITEPNYEFDSATIALLNRDDGSLIIVDQNPVVDGVTEYEMPVEVIAHYGKWNAQVIYHKGQEDYTSPLVSFSVERFLADSRPPRLTEVESIAKLRKEAKELIEVLEGMTYDNESLVDVLQAKDGELTLDARLVRDYEDLDERKAEKSELAKKANLEDIGAPTQEQVDDWLDRNPEATTTVRDGSITQSKIAPEAIGPNEINSYSDSINVLNPADLTQGKYMRANYVGDPIVEHSNANWYGNLNYIPVKAGDVIRLNFAYQADYFIAVNSSGLMTQRRPRIHTNRETEEITITADTVGIYVAIFKDHLDDAMITINRPMPPTFFPFGSETKKTLHWLEVTESNLNSQIIEKLNSADNKEDKWHGKTMITAGDSITFQDGVAYGQGPQAGQIAKGWQTHVKENLGLASVTNIAVSGRPMADGTNNGVGTVTSITSRSDYSNFDLLVIAAGTNDFKLNVPIGEFTSSNYNRATFYGAYQTAIEHVLDINPNIRTVLFTPLHRNNGGYNSTTFANSAGHTLKDYRQAIFEIGEYYGVPVCDMYGNSGISIYTLDTDTIDGLHPNDTGYEKMGMYASSFIIVI